MRLECYLIASVKVDFCYGWNRKELAENAHETSSIKVVRDSSTVDHLACDVLEHTEWHELVMVLCEYTLKLQNRHLKKTIKFYN